MVGKTESGPGAGNQPLLPVLAVNFVGTLGFSIVVPFLVYLVTEWGGNALVYGLIGATYSAFQLIGAPVLGRWSDRVGRRKILLLSQAGTTVSWLVFLLAFFVPAAALVDVESSALGEFTLTVPLVLLFLARAADGITGGNVSVANAYLADITPEAERSRNFGRMALSGNLGFVLGPALAGVLGATVYGELLPVIAALAIAIIATLIIAFGLEDCAPCSMTAPPSKRSLRKVAGQEHRDCYEIEDPAETKFTELVRLEGVAPMLTVYFLVMLGFSVFYVGFPVHAVGALEWTVARTGLFFTYLSVVMVLVQGPVLARASDRFSDSRLAVVGALLLTAGFAGLYWPQEIAVFGAATLIAAGNGLMWPSVMSMLSAAAGRTHQGAVQGVSGSAGAVASIAGLIGGGVLYTLVGAWVFVLAALLILPVSVLAGPVSASE